jgi:hypothetical protein
MKRVLFVLALTLITGLAPLAALADNPNVRWADIIGIVQAGNVVGSGTGQVAGGLQPWSTSRGSAAVNLQTGDVHFRVEGLVLAGGNSIGTPDGITQVKGTLVCDTDGSAGGGNSTLVDTPLVTLSAQGDAEFNGSVGSLPAACLEPDIAFLVRIAAGRWIAAGVVRTP